MKSLSIEHTLEMGPVARDRVFNLGYFTWAEQQGVSIADFERRRDQRFWNDRRPLIDGWDEKINAFNNETGA